MKHFLLLFIVLTQLLTSCSKSTECEKPACTKEFRTITVRFVDANNNPQTVKDFTAVNKRTGEIMSSNTDFTNQVDYVVASDSDLLKLSEKGDTILVSAIDLKSNSKIQVEYIVTGGICSCHVNKISGPDTVKI
jgi:hypothetical protein